MGRLTRSWDLFKTSFSVIQQDKELLWMPVLSFLATAVAIGGVVGVGFLSGIFASFTGEGGAVDMVVFAWVFVAYIATAFVQVYFHAATIAGANERLAGGDPTVGSCLRVANKHLGRLFLWSIVVATVNVILQAIRERAGIVGSLMASFAGMAWNLATYFVVPSLIFEDLGIGGSLKHSGGLFKKTWGETLIGEVGIGWIAMIVSVLILIVGGGSTLFMLASGLWPVAILLGSLTVLSLVIAAVVFTVAGAVYKTALYRYAAQGHAGGPFVDMQLAQAWRPA